MHQAAYRFFDSSFVVESDSLDFLADFDQIYHRFRINKCGDWPVYRLLLAGAPSLSFDTHTVQSTNTDSLYHFAFNAIPNDVMARVRSHFLFHGAALRTPEGEGLILIGKSGLGKTTLTLALIEHGFGFLSDDIAACRRSTGWISPFPRSLGLRSPGSQQGEKKVVDIEAIAPDRIAPPCPARFLFVLNNPSTADMQQCWYLCVDRLCEPLLSDLKTLVGSEHVWTARGEPNPVIRIELAMPLSRVEPRIEEICRRHQIILFEVTNGAELPPDFTNEPVCTTLSASQAAQELLVHSKNGPRSSMLRTTFDGRVSRLYLALAALAGGMACYRLTVGRREKMAAQILEIAGRKP